MILADWCNENVSFISVLLPLSVGYFFFPMNFSSLATKISAKDLSTAGKKWADIRGKRGKRGRCREGAVSTVPAADV